MDASTRDITKRVRRPRADAPGTPVVVRMQPEQLAALDAWISIHPDPKPSRPEAIREAVAEHLKAKSRTDLGPL
jgi:hypothetical protein